MKNVLIQLEEFDATLKWILLDILFFTQPKKTGSINNEESQAVFIAQASPSESYKHHNDARND